jgi:hypothetical protein
MPSKPDQAEHDQREADRGASTKSIAAQHCQ